MKRPARRLAGSALALSTLFALGAALPQEGKEESATFDTAASASKSIAAATRLAAKKHRRVLIVWGSDEREGDLQLHEALRRGRTEQWPFYYEYVITPLAQGARNEAVAEALGATPSSEGAALTILDEGGKPLASRTATEFLSPEGWNTDGLGAFLAQHVVVPQDAEVVMKNALDAATKEDKRLFVHLGAPW